jgi:hypothetical protein
MKENKSKTAWSIELGLYPGILLGIRSYSQEDSVIHVLYVPFMDVALTIYK